MDRGYETAIAGMPETSFTRCGNFRFRYAIIDSMATVTRRRALAALAPVLGAGAASRLLGGDAAAQQQHHAAAATATGHHAASTNGHVALQHAGLREGARVDHERNGF